MSLHAVEKNDTPQQQVTLISILESLKQTLKHVKERNWNTYSKNGVAEFIENIISRLETVIGVKNETSES